MQLTSITGQAKYVGRLLVDMWACLLLAPEPIVQRLVACIPFECKVPGDLSSRIDWNDGNRSWFSGKVSTFSARKLQRHACYLLSITS